MASLSSWRGTSCSFAASISAGAAGSPWIGYEQTLRDAGYDDVATLLQSGNVVLTSAVEPERLERDLADLLREEFGFDIAVVARTRDELAGVIADDPFGDEADDPARYQVSFLSAEPEAAGVAELEAADVAPSAWPCAGARSTPGTLAAWAAPSWRSSSAIGASGWRSPRATGGR